MTTFDHARSHGYDRRATRLLTGMYRTLAADIDTATGRGATVADIGTGPAKLLSHLAIRRPDLRLHGVDASPHMIELARDHLTGLPAHLAVGDVTALPHPDASFDHVVSSLSMREWPDLDAAARELRRARRRHSCPGLRGRGLPHLPALPRAGRRGHHPRPVIAGCRARHRTPVPGAARRP
ncbi:class I SAM-dependent methyltransferase [Nocardia sp. AG03]|uniref:class I SAM-dependent methyltransferase n=1 Tax=Nocardia sp. AG03 TaxID=3025312 RepID=UPI0024186AA2|nr:class I SAM-dependent methyltransferase [Nocardia sp. AG03]